MSNKTFNFSAKKMTITNLGDVKGDISVHIGSSGVECGYCKQDIPYLGRQISACVVCGWPYCPDCISSHDCECRVQEKKHSCDWTYTPTIQKHETIVDCGVGYYPCRTVEPHLHCLDCGKHWSLNGDPLSAEGVSLRKPGQLHPKILFNPEVRTDEIKAKAQETCVVCGEDFGEKEKSGVIERYHLGWCEIHIKCRDWYESKKKRSQKRKECAS